MDFNKPVSPSYLLGSALSPADTVSFDYLSLPRRRTKLNNNSRHRIKATVSFDEKARIIRDTKSFESRPSTSRNVRNMRSATLPLPRPSSARNSRCFKKKPLRLASTLGPETFKSIFLPEIAEDRPPWIVSKKSGRLFEDTRAKAHAEKARKGTLPPSSVPHKKRCCEQNRAARTQTSPRTLPHLRRSKTIRNP